MEIERQMQIKMREQSSFHKVIVKTWDGEYATSQIHTIYNFLQYVRGKGTYCRQGNFIILCYEEFIQGRKQKFGQHSLQLRKNWRLKGNRSQYLYKQFQPSEFSIQHYLRYSLTQFVHQLIELILRTFLPQHPELLNYFLIILSLQSIYFFKIIQHYERFNFLIKNNCKLIHPHYYSQFRDDQCRTLSSYYKLIQICCPFEKNIRLIQLKSWNCIFLIDFKNKLSPFHNIYEATLFRDRFYMFAYANSEVILFGCTNLNQVISILPVQIKKNKFDYILYFSSVLNLHLKFIISTILFMKRGRVLGSLFFKIQSLNFISLQ
ncbi:unnamed protein product [Paramecium pentaurelia]|uniref:Transmembrane protein n=1 Tax=Paramecium pentaurelia TaxID=43138 RepID=A0A8S1WEA8_9CILI|nr:unnamed protein product [Paramecium pentaurelia]